MSKDKSTLEHCPDPECGDRGYTVHMQPFATDEDGNVFFEPAQQQCEFCYTNKNSVFNNSEPAGDSEFDIYIDEDKTNGH